MTGVLYVYFLFEAKTFPVLESPRENFIRDGTGSRKFHEDLVACKCLLLFA